MPSTTEKEFFEKLMAGKTLATHVLNPSIQHLKARFDLYKQRFNLDPVGIRTSLDIVEFTNYNQVSVAIEVVRKCD